MAKAKSNKSFSKRLKITSKGKVLARIPGQNHFNAKVRRQKQLGLKGLRPFNITKKQLNQNLPNQ